MSNQSRRGRLLEKECKELSPFAMSSFNQASNWPERENGDWNPQWLSFPCLLMGGQENCQSTALVFNSERDGRVRSVRDELRLAAWFLGRLLQCQPGQRVQPARPSTVTRALLKRLIREVEGGEPQHRTDENKRTCFECGCSVKKAGGGEWLKKGEAGGGVCHFSNGKSPPSLPAPPRPTANVKVLSLTSAEWCFCFSTAGQEFNPLMKMIFPLF